MDGLRGIAALLVVFFHLYGHSFGELSAHVPVFLHQFFRHGDLGVQIFFVLSGFAISSSFANSKITGRYVGIFALRRSVRLDPPYWASIALAVFMSFLAISFFGQSDRSLPSWGHLIAHVFYLQNLLEMGDIVPIYWTLCLEIQFYLVLALALYGLQRATGQDSVRGLLESRLVRAAALGLLGWSIATFCRLVPEPHPGTFVPFWFYFQLGAVVYWFSRGWVSGTYAWLSILVVAIGLAFRTVDVGAGLVTALVLITVLHNDWDKVALSGRVFQYLGRISYSLYLFHPIVGWSLISLVKRVLGPGLGLLESASIFVFAICVSIIFSHFAYKLLERPVHSLSRRVSL